MRMYPSEAHDSDGESDGQGVHEEVGLPGVVHGSPQSEDEDEGEPHLYEDSLPQRQVFLENVHSEAVPVHLRSHPARIRAWIHKTHA